MSPPPADPADPLPRHLPYRTPKDPRPVHQPVPVNQYGGDQQGDQHQVDPDDHSKRDDHHNTPQHVPPRAAPAALMTFPGTTLCRTDPEDVLDPESRGLEQAEQVHQVQVPVVGHSHVDNGAGLDRSDAMTEQRRTQQRSQRPAAGELECHPAVLRHGQPTPSCGGSSSGSGTDRTSTRSRPSARSRLRNPCSSAWSMKLPVSTVRSSCSMILTSPSAGTSSAGTLPTTRISYVVSAIVRPPSATMAVVGARSVIREALPVSLRHRKSPAVPRTG